MLTPESYQTAWLVYGAATLFALAYLYFWVGQRISRGGRLALVLILAGLALTPAYPGADSTETWAPALFAAAFELLANGTEAAARPARSLLAAESMVMGLCIVGWLVSRLLQRGRRPGPEATTAAGTESVAATGTATGTATGAAAGAATGAESGS